MAARPPERFYRGIIACDLAWCFGFRSGAFIGACDGYEVAAGSASSPAARMQRWVKPKGDDERDRLKFGLAASVVRGAALGSFLDWMIGEGPDWTPDPWEEVRYEHEHVHDDE